MNHWLLYAMMDHCLSCYDGKKSRGPCWMVMMIDVKVDGVGGKDLIHPPLWEMHTLAKLQHTLPCYKYFDCCLLFSPKTINQGRHVSTPFGDIYNPHQNYWNMWAIGPQQFPPTPTPPPCNPEMCKNPYELQSMQVTFTAGGGVSASYGVDFSFFV